MTSYPEEWLTRVAARSQIPVAQLDPAFIGELMAEAHAKAIMLAPCRSADWADPALVPPPVVTAIVAAISDIVVNPRGLVGESIGGYAWQSTGAMQPPADFFKPSDARIIRQQGGCAGAAKSVMLSPDGVLVDDEWWTRKRGNDGQPINY